MSKMGRKVLDEQLGGYDHDYVRALEATLQQTLDEINNKERTRCKMSNHKAVCPTNPEHKNFLATAVVHQEWIVDESGNFMEVQDECSQVYTKPDMGQEWLCATCHAVAEIVETGGAA